MARRIKTQHVCLSCRLGLNERTSARRLATSSSRQHQPERSSLAPKPFIDIKHIRQNPELYAKNCADRKINNHLNTPFRIIDLFQEWQGLQKGARGFRERSNDLQRQLANLSPKVSRDDPASRLAKPSREDIVQEAREIKSQVISIEALEEQLHSKMMDLAIQLPNLTSLDTPIGEEPRVVGYLNEHLKGHSPPSNNTWKSHTDIGTEFHLLDFAASATTSGWGWYFLMNEAALLEQALVQYALDIALKRGWMIVTPPSIVYSHIASACGFRPRDQNGEQQTYVLERPSKDQRKPELCLAGTGEIPLAGMKANQTLDEDDLPLKMIGVSRCYRAEAGARGVDTKGLYRVHEFTKVEMFGWALPDDHSGDDGSSRGSGSVAESASSDAIFNEMMDIQSEILESLGLPCRILEMPTADLGASASRKRDIEAFFPSRQDKNGGWGEVTSTSMCSDYQSRRLATRVRMGGTLKWPQTINGTAMAVPRVLAAILENGWDETEGVVRIPRVLRAWMGGREVITKDKSP